jgi:hypothetical protein
VWSCLNSSSVQCLDKVIHRPKLAPWEYYSSPTILNRYNYYFHYYYHSTRLLKKGKGHRGSGRTFVRFCFPKHAKSELVRIYCYYLLLPLMDGLRQRLLQTHLETIWISSTLLLGEEEKDKDKKKQATLLRIRLPMRKRSTTGNQSGSSTKTKPSSGRHGFKPKRSEKNAGYADKTGKSEWNK